jgi:hypothetical protein
MNRSTDSPQRLPLPRIVSGALSGTPLALVYGALTRWIFGTINNDLLIVMTCAFIFFVPVAIGVITVGLAPQSLLRTWTYATLMPLLSAILTVAVIALMGLEEVVCIVLALPLFLPLASMGGLLVRWLRRRKDDSASYPLVGLLLLAPYLLSPLEMQLPFDPAVRTVENTIVIDAAPEVVWRNIEEVDEITPDEQRFSPFHWLGLPRPQRAMMIDPGQNAIRYGYFENGLIFEERIKVWNAPNVLAFTIDRDPTAEIPDLLYQIDGPYFQMLDGYYQITPREDGKVLLTLSSRHRLTTHFNGYAGFWTDAVMRDLRQDILEIVRDRCVGKINE